MWINRTQILNVTYTSYRLFVMDWEQSQGEVTVFPKTWTNFKESINNGRLSPNMPKFMCKKLFTKSSISYKIKKGSEIIPK